MRGFILIFMLSIASVTAFAGGGSIIEIIDFAHVEVQIDRAQIEGDVVVKVCNRYQPWIVVAEVLIPAADSSKVIDLTYAESNTYIAVVYTQGGLVQGHQFNKS